MIESKPEVDELEIDASGRRWRWRHPSGLGNRQQDFIQPYLALRKLVDLPGQLCK